MFYNDCSWLACIWQVMDTLERLLSTLEARVALNFWLVQLLRFPCATVMPPLCYFPHASLTQWAHVNHLYPTYSGQFLKLIFLCSLQVALLLLYLLVYHIKTVTTEYFTGSGLNLSTMERKLVAAEARVTL